MAVVCPIAVGMVRTSLSKPTLRMHAICQCALAKARVGQLLEIDGERNLQRAPFESGFVGKFIEVFETQRHTARGHRNDRAKRLAASRHARAAALGKGWGNGAGGEDRTPDLRFTKPLHYRCATPALGVFLMSASGRAHAD